MKMFKMRKISEVRTRWLTFGEYVKEGFKQCYEVDVCHILKINNLEKRIKKLENKRK